MKKLLVIACALALGACAAQQSALQSADSRCGPGSKRSRRRILPPCAGSGSARTMTTTSARWSAGTRPVHASIASAARASRKRTQPPASAIETITREQLEDIKERGGSVVIGGEG